MRTFKLYQIHLSPREIETINRNGYKAAREQFPKVAAHMDSSVLAKQVDFEHYDHVAYVEAEDLEELFELTNIHQWDSRITRVKKMHSTSVGDIVHDVKNDTYHFCDRIGWKEIKAA